MTRSMFLILVGLSAPFVGEILLRIHLMVFYSQMTLLTLNALTLLFFTTGAILIVMGLRHITAE